MAIRRQMQETTISVLWISAFSFTALHFSNLIYLRLYLHSDFYLLGIVPLFLLFFIRPQVHDKKSMGFLFLYGMIGSLLIYYGDQYKNLAIHFFISIICFCSMKNLPRYYRSSKFIIKFFAWAGLALIFLNSITLFFWLADVEIPFTQVERFSGFGRPDLDPYFFGLFGLTESYIFTAGGIDRARLQGWSSEPQHWGYFVFMFLSLFFLLYGNKMIGKFNFFIALVIILSYSFFLGSSSVLLSYLYFILASLFFYFFPGRGGIKRIAFFVYAVFIPALLAPAVLVLFIDSQYIIDNNFLGEGNNWAGKVEFLDLSSPFLVFLPGSSMLTVTHNLFLDSYFSLGYFLLGFLMLVFYTVCCIAVDSENPHLAFAVVLFLAAHIFLIPSAFFYPSFLTWLILIRAGCALAERSHQDAERQERIST